MKRPHALLVAVLMLLGCKGPGQAVDPFFGRTTIEAPRTGSVSGRRAEPYYQAGDQRRGPQAVAPLSSVGRAQPAAGAPAPVSEAGIRPAPPSGSYSSDRGASPQGDGRFGSSWSAKSVPAGLPVDNTRNDSQRIAIPVTPERGSAAPGSDRSGSAAGASAAGPAAASSGGSAGGDLRSALDTSAGETLAGRARSVQTLQPRPKPATTSAQDAASGSSVAPAAREPGRVEVPGRAVNITDLPEPRVRTSSTEGQSLSAPDGYRLVSGTGEPDDAQVQPAAAPAAAPAGSASADSAPTGSAPSGSAPAGQSDAPAESTPQGNYGYGPDYRWLRGKLEYSQSERRWKLRYIPIDGTTDDFGGSVVLTDAKVLSGFERGDFVEVRGKLGRRDPDNRCYAPAYEVAEIKRVGP